MGCSEWMSALGTLSSLLKGASTDGEGLARALKPLALATGGALAVMLVRYQQEEVSHLEVIGRWPLEQENRGWPSRPLEPETLPPDWWRSLLGGDLVVKATATNSILGRWKRLCLLPLRWDGELFGILGVADWRGRHWSSLIGFLQTAASILELWIGWVNEKKRLEDFIDFMPNPTFVMHRDGRITAWNKATEEMTGWKAERVLNKGNYEHAIPFYGIRRPILSNLILHPDPYWESTYPEFQRVGNDLYTLSFCPALPDGGAYLTTKTSKIFDLTGRLWGSIHTVRDVTRERQIEKSLHRSESMYRAITDFAGIGMMLFQRWRVIYCNEQMARLIGASQGINTPEDFLGRLHPEDRETLRKNLDSLFDGHADSFRVELRAQDGERLRYFQCFAQVMEYEDRPTIHFIMDDITEQKELAHKARLNELRMYHEDRLTALGVMAAGIAHELNQPLNTIRVITEGILFGRDEGWGLDQEELYENLEMISRQVVRMSEVIRNIRDFAREDRGQPEEEVDPNRAVEGVFSMIGRQLEAHGISVIKRLDRSVPPVRARLSRLEQVVMNLIVNARQALDDCGHEDRELWVRTGVNDGCVCIEVGDNATGVPPGLMSKIFDPFFTTKEVGKGTGLGLTISQSIVAEMGGRIEVFNNDRGGATFIVRLPIRGERC